MTISEVLENESLRQQEFPVCRDRIFMAHAAVCAMPQRVAQAIADCAFEGTTDDQEKFVGQLLYRTRELTAEILGASIREVALVGPTSLGLSYVAAGLDFEPGDNVICYFEDYPSNVYPWLALRAKGVEIRYVEPDQLGRIRCEDVMTKVDDRTRLVALASCHFISGWRIDVDAIGKSLHDRDVLFCLDAIQTVGAFPSSVEHVDFLAADAHKWMLGPCSAGIFYVKRELQDRLKPLVFGWHNVECPDFVAADEIELKQDARRYEAGTHNLAGIAGMKAAFDLLNEVGIHNIGRELLRKRKLIAERLLSSGWDVIGHDAPEQNQGGMLSAQHNSKDLKALHQQLTDENITLSLRTDRQGEHYLRFSPHFYNTDDEIDRVIDRLS